MVESRIGVLYAVKGNVKLETGDWVEFSDRLRIQGVTASKGDTAIVREFNGKKIVVDIVKKRIVSEEVSDEELEQQKREFETLCGGY